MSASKPDKRADLDEVIDGSFQPNERGLPLMRLNSPARASLSARPPASSAREFYTAGLGVSFKGGLAIGCNSTTPLHQIDNRVHHSQL